MDTILFVTDLCSGSRLPLLAGIRTCAAKHNLQVQVTEIARPQVSLSKALSYWKPLGCIIEGTSLITPRSPLLAGIPVVHVDPNARTEAAHPRLTVVNDNAGIARTAFEALLHAGCEHFAFVGWTRSVNWSTARLDTFRKLLEPLGRTCHELLKLWVLGNAADLGTLLHPWLLKLPRPCGIFAANDDVAVVLLDACRACRLSVPDDIAIIGVDDEPSVCETTRPTLSSVRPDFFRGGFLSADLLIRHIADRGLPPEHLVYGHCGFTDRQSTRRLASPLPRNIRSVLELIRREATNGLCAADVVRSLGVSERLAEKRFKAATGHRITEEITAVRLAHVLKLLRDQNQTISPIANLSGWKSDVYLKRLFKARFGCTMREWRDANAP